MESQEAGDVTQLVKCLSSMQGPGFHFQYCASQVHTCNFSTQKVGQEDWGQGHSGIYNNFEASLGYMRHCVKRRARGVCVWGDVRSEGKTQQGLCRIFSYCWLECDWDLAVEYPQLPGPHGLCQKNSQGVV